MNPIPFLLIFGIPLAIYLITGTIVASGWALLFIIGIVVLATIS